MALKFAANISTMFAESNDFKDRYLMAKNFGFGAVECQFPYDYPVELLAEAREKAAVEQVLINSYPGKTVNNEFGYAVASQKEQFKNSIDLSLRYAKALNCTRIHVIAGLSDDSIPFKDMEEIYVANLKYAAEVFEKNDIIGLIEPICPEVKQKYFLSSFIKAINYIDHINSANLKLLMDVFHLQMLHGKLTAMIKEALPNIGHVQISQAPNRHEPNAEGEINYHYILSLLKRLGYDGWIGLEYFPSGSTKDSLNWIEEFGFSLN